MKTKIPFVIVMSVLGLCAAMCAEGEKSKITNAKVIEMIKASLPDSTIVKAIQQGPCALDTGPDALIDLKKQGASEKILEAVQAASAPSPATAAPVQPTANAPMAMTATGVFLVDGTTRTQLQSGRTQMRSGGSPFSVRVTAVLNGAKSPQRFSNPKPVFEVALPSSLQPEGYVVLMQPVVKKNERHIETMTAAAFAGAREGKNRTIPLTFEKAAPAGSQAQFITYRVTPPSPLAGGEYVLQVLNSQYYDFGVDAAK